jgi:predicted acyl esterase
MNLMSHLIQRQLGLDPPLTRDLLIERDLPVPMPDGTVLLADRWAPRTGGDKLPVALMRSPYGRGALIWFRSSLKHADVFVRLCDVDPGGKSWNVCDGLTGLSTADQVTAATVRLWPAAYRFKIGHRIRVQVASGSFPRYARNPGTGEPHATAARLVAADQSVYHDPEHLSAITLAVRTAGAEGAI